MPWLVSFRRYQWFLGNLGPWKIRPMLIRSVAIRMYDDMVLKKINTVSGALYSSPTYSIEACVPFLPYIRKDMLWNVRTSYFRSIFIPVFIKGDQGKKMPIIRYISPEADFFYIVWSLWKAKLCSLHGWPTENVLYCNSCSAMTYSRGKMKSDSF